VSKPQTEGDSGVLTSRETDWAEIFRRLDEAGVPEDFLADRDSRLPEERALWEDEGGVSPSSSGGI
jgi:hypothetical protein